MIKFIKNLFKGREQQCNNDFSALELHEQLLINKVIELLKNKPENFSARWFTGANLDLSVRSNDRKILIMIQTGEITQPINVNMTNQQKEQIKHLIAPIVEEDSKYIIDNL